MKPNFTLSLSFEGITLLHRAAGGWRSVGEVPLTAPELKDTLAVLRKTAASLEPGGGRHAVGGPHHAADAAAVQAGRQDQFAEDQEYVGADRGNHVVLAVQQNALVDPRVVPLGPCPDLFEAVEVVHACQFGLDTQPQLADSRLYACQFGIALYVWPGK